MTLSLSKICMRLATVGQHITPIDEELANRVANLTLGGKSVEVSVVPKLAQLGASRVKTQYQLSSQVVQELFNTFRDNAISFDLDSCTTFNGVSFGGNPFKRLESFKIRCPKALTTDNFVALCGLMPQVINEFEIHLHPISGQVVNTLPKAIRLAIVESNITNEDLQEISKRMGDTLEELDISNCGLITSFAGCSFPHLRSCIAEKVPFTNEGLRALSEACPQLEVLKLDASRGFTTLQGCSFKSLVSIKLGMNLDIKNQDILALSNMCGNTLEELDIGACVSISHFRECNFPKLKKLNAANTRIDNEGLKTLSIAASGLQVLSFYGSRFIQTYSGVYFRDLRELNCTCTTRLSNQELKAISLMCGKTLEVLDISHCEGITSFDGTEFSSLSRLVVQSNPHFTESSVESLSRVCSSTLQALILSATGVHSIRDTFVFHNLRKLDISNQQMQNSDMQMVSKLYGATLEALAICGCNNITTFAGCQLPCLDALYAKGKTSLTEEWLQSLAVLCGNNSLEMLDLSGLGGSYVIKNQQYPFAKITVWDKAFIF